MRNFLKATLLLFLFAFASSPSETKAQSQDYSMTIENVTRVDTDSTTFDIIITKVAGDSVKLQMYAFTIGWDYSQCANEGAVTCGYVTGSAASSLPTVHKSPSVSFNTSTLKIYISVPTVALSSASKIATSSGTKLGTFYLKGANPFVAGSHANFRWENVVLRCFVDRSTTSPAPNISAVSRHFVLVNTALN